MSNVGFSLHLYVLFINIVYIATSITNFVVSCPLGKLACRLYQHMQRNAASLKIQTNYRRYLSRKIYNKLKLSVVVFQARLRSMVAGKKFRIKQQNKAAILLQVRTLYSHTARGGKMDRNTFWVMGLVRLCSPKPLSAKKNWLFDKYAVGQVWLTKLI